MSGFQIIGQDPDLVAGWNCDQSPAGYTQDVSPNGHVGTLIGPPRQGSDRFGDFLGFDGVGDYVNVGEAGSLLTDDFSLLTIARTSVGGRLISRRLGGGIAFDFYLNPSNGNLTFYDGVDTRSYVMDLRDGGRHFVGAVISSGQVYFSIDGELMPTSGSVNVTTAAIDTLIGAWGSGGNFAGDIYNAGIYSKDKSTAWWAQEYNRAKLYF